MTAGSQGHVGYVRGVYRDGSVSVEHYNGTGDRAYSVSRVKAPRYLYVGVRPPA
jgi:surface antigen